MSFQNIDVTSKFLSTYFPPTKTIENFGKELKYSNNVIFKNIIVYGFPGSGKTTLANAIVDYAMKKYGTINVNASMSEDGNLGSLLNFGLQPKLVNILFCDNTTLAKHKPETLQQYFMIRHLFKERFGFSNGYILSIIALHRYHGIPIELRSCIDGIIVRDVSLNPYDRSILQGFIEDTDLYKFIKDSAEIRYDQSHLMNYSVYVGRTYKGIISIEPAKRYLFKEPSSLLESIVAISNRR